MESARPATSFKSAAAFLFCQQIPATQNGKRNNRTAAMRAKTHKAIPNTATASAKESMAKSKLCMGGLLRNRAVALFKIICVNFSGLAKRCWRNPHYQNLSLAAHKIFEAALFIPRLKSPGDYGKKRLILTRTL